MGYSEKFKLLVLGDSTVGKISILDRCTNGVFNANYLATAYIDNFKKDKIINNKIIRINIWDTLAQLKYYSLAKGLFRNIKGIMVVFDVTNSETYENIKYWIQSIKINMGCDIDEISLVIIGNKMDSNEREVNKKEAEIYCAELGYPYFETSAKTGENINETIKYLIKEVLKKTI